MHQQQLDNATTTTQQCNKNYLTNATTTTQQMLQQQLLNNATTTTQQCNDDVNMHVVPKEVQL